MEKNLRKNNIKSQKTSSTEDGTSLLMRTNSMKVLIIINVEIIGFVNRWSYHEVCKTDIYTSSFDRNEAVW